MTRRSSPTQPPAPRSLALPGVGSRGVPQWLAAGLAVLILPGAVLAAGKQPSTWDQSTRIETADDAAQANAANPVCAPVAANISRRIATIKSLKAAIHKAEEAPPTSVKSALQGLFGKAEPTAKMLAHERKIVSERRAADDLNAMLGSLKCAPVDIDAALADQPEQATGGPVVPDAMPDDLVPVPNRY